MAIQQAYGQWNFFGGLGGVLELRTWMQQIEDDTGLNANDAWRIAHDHKSWTALRPAAGQAFHRVSEQVSECQNTVTHESTQTPFPKGCLSSLHNT